MSVITQARPAAKLSITEAGTPHFFVSRDSSSPAMLGIPGGSNLEMQLLNVNVTGKADAHQPGSIQIILYAHAGIPEDAKMDDPNQWLPIAPSIAGDIGGADELPNTSWMLRAENILFNYSNGKMQGTYRTNVADSQQLEIDFEHDLTGITHQDPPIVFAVGALFTPATPSSDGERRRKRPRAEEEEPPVLADLELSYFQLTD